MVRLIAVFCIALTGLATAAANQAGAGRGSSW